MIKVTLPILPELDEKGWAWVTDPHVPIREEDLYDGLKVIVTASTGTNHICVEECERRGIEVLSLLDDRSGLEKIKASSEATFMLLLMTLRNAKHALEEVKAGRWQENEYLFRGNELYGKTVGIIGLGRIGRNMYFWLNSFKAKVNAIYDPPKKSANTLEEVFENQIVIVSCSLNEETNGMITKAHLLSMPENGVIINTARGEIFAHDVHEALMERKDLRMGVDVLPNEATGGHLQSPLLGLNNVTVLPHMAGVTVESQAKAAEIAFRLLADWHRKSVE